MEARCHVLHAAVHVSVETGRALYLPHPRHLSRCNGRRRLWLQFRAWEGHCDCASLSSGRKVCYERKLEGNLGFLDLEFRRKLLAVRCDNAGEFWGDAFNDYIRKHGIARQHSCPYSHQQNGKAERAIRTIEGRVLAMITAVGAPMNLWGEATLTAANLWEVTPSRTLPPGVTPFEMSHGRKPDLSHLRVWGSRCFARVPIELQTKLIPRSWECLFMGYPDGLKGCRVCDLTTGAFFNLRDVIFDENLPSLQLSSAPLRCTSPALPLSWSSPRPQPSFTLLPSSRIRLLVL